jgi:hypothetical protein
MRDGGSPTPLGLRAEPPSLDKKSPGGFHLRAIRLKVFLERLSISIPSAAELVRHSLRVSGGDGGEDKGQHHPVPSAQSWRVRGRGRDYQS